MRLVSALRPWRRAVPLTITSVVALALVASACSEAPNGVEGNGGDGGSAPKGGSGGTSALGGSGGSGGSTGGGAGTGSSGAPNAGKAGSISSGGAGGAGGAAGTGGSLPAGSGGTGNASAAAGMAGAGGAPLMRGPTPPSATSKFPFPQNRQSTSCTYPVAYDNEDVKRVYAAWKTDLVTSDGAGGFQRVKRPAEHNLDQDSTVSEGIGYGMIIAVYMDDQKLFDDLWKYEQTHTWSYAPPGGGGGQGTALMNWYILKDGNTPSDGSGAATDADEDMAWALIQADKQWGGQGSLGKSYLDTAKQVLGDIWKYEIDSNHLIKNGSGWGDDNSLNISYFAPAYYRVFAKVSGEQRWGKDVIDYSYQVIGQNLKDGNGNTTNGLVPAFSTSGGDPAHTTPGQSGLAFNYQYDSCRTPFRIGLDACWAGETRAKDYVAKTSSFFGGLGAANIKDGYELNGTPKPQFPDGFAGLSAAFIGPAGVGAMHSPSYQTFINETWDLLKLNNMWCGGQYYDESWTIMSMLMMSGNFLDYTAY